MLRSSNPLAYNVTESCCWSTCLQNGHCIRQLGLRRNLFLQDSYFGPQTKDKGTALLDFLISCGANVNCTSKRVSTVRVCTVVKHSTQTQLYNDEIHSQVEVTFACVCVVLCRGRHPCIMLQQVVACNMCELCWAHGVRCQRTDDHGLVDVGADDFALDVSVLLEPLSLLYLQGCMSFT